LPFCHLRLKSPKPLSQPYPRQLVTIGDHIRKRRLDLGLFQLQVAQQIGVDESTITNWEKGRGEPEIQFIPLIIRFLGYNPLPPAKSLVERIIRCRRTLGLARYQLAKRLGLDVSTIWHWEVGLAKKPWPSYAKLFLKWLAQNEDIGKADRQAVLEGRDA